MLGATGLDSTPDGASKAEQIHLPAARPCFDAAQDTVGFLNCRSILWACVKLSVLVQFYVLFFFFSVAVIHRKLNPGILQICPCDPVLLWKLMEETKVLT